MLVISSLTLLISISPLFVAADLDPRSQEDNSFVTVPLVKGSNLTLPNGAFDIEAARRSILAARSINRQNPIDLERRSPSAKDILATFIPKHLAKSTTGILANYIPPKLRQQFRFIDDSLPVKGRVRLGRDRSAAYIGEMTIGTPPETFLVGFATDLNVSRIGIFDPNPKPRQGDYTKKKVYTGSQTYKKDVARTYRYKEDPKRECNVVGFRDTVTLGGIKVKGLYFQGIPSFSPTRIQEGTIALGFQGSERGAPSTFMDIALSERQIKEKVFGVSFAPGRPEYHFGGTNAELYSQPIEFHEVIRSRDRPVLSDWLLGNARLYVGTLVLNGLETIISTDSLLTWGPKAQVEKIYGRIQNSKKVNAEDFKEEKGFKEEDVEGLYEFPCSSMPKVELSWDNSKVRWEYVGFTIPVDAAESTTCYGTIAAYDPKSKRGQKENGRWTIGTSFLEGLYTGFFIKGPKAEIMFGKLKLK